MLPRNTKDALRIGGLMEHIGSTWDQSNGEEETDSTGVKKELRELCG